MFGSPASLRPASGNASWPAGSVLRSARSGARQRGRASRGSPSGTLSSMSDFLAALRDRVLIFDGAFGTWVQDQDLGPDDFGGPELEGCNEHVVLTRPDLIAEMHREF